MSLFPSIYDEFILDENSKNLVSTFVLKHATGKNILDCGCGTGWLSYILSKEGLSVDAFDNNEEMLSFAKTHYTHPNIQYFKADMLNIKLQAVYDTIIIMTDGLNYFKDIPTLERFMQTCKNHLSNQGRLIFDVYDPLVLDFFKDEYLEEKMIHNMHVQWSIQSLDNNLSHYIKITHPQTSEQNLHFVETIFEPSMLESLMTSLDFQFDLIYDFDVNKRKGLKRVYVAKRT